MSGRHQNTTFRAVDDERLNQLRAALGDRDALEALLAATARDPEANPEHCEEVWTRDVVDAVRPFLLRSFLRADPPRWAPLLAEAMCGLEGADAQWFMDQTLYELASRQDLELYCLPDAYGLHLYASATYAARFQTDAPHPEWEALREALGGEPDPDEKDLREALRDRVLSPDRVRWIADRIEVPESLPAISWTLPHAVEAFDVDPEHLLMVLGDIAAFFRGTADAGLSAHVLWQANP